MAGFDVDPGSSSPLAGPATPVFVYRFDPLNPVTVDGEQTAYALLPNVHWEGAAQREGSEPATAQFSYLLDNTYHRDKGWPCEFEDLWPMQGAPSKYRVKQDDRIVAMAFLPDGSKRLLFDGFVTAPQADLTADSQQVTFTATSVEIRCWDRPVGGRWQRDAIEGIDPDPGGGARVVYETGLPTRFNPEGRPNCTPDGHDVEKGAHFSYDFPHPVFIETRGGDEDDDGDEESHWTLAKAAKYLLARGNGPEAYVDNPDFSVLDAMLDNRVPKDVNAGFDPDKPDTYDESPVTLGDYDCGDRPWPEVLGELLGYYGFGMRFKGELDETNTPWHYLEIYRRDQAGPTEPKSLLLPKTGADVDPDAVNVGAFHVAQDFHGVANEIEIETKPKLYEASFVLAPGFSPAAGDQTAAASKAFLRSVLATATDATRGKYRRYIADEMGEGHWSYAGAAWTTLKPIDLSKVLPDVGLPGNFLNGQRVKIRGYVRRLRPGRNTLITVDESDEKKPLKKMLHISRDYAGPNPPCVWDGTGTWQPISASWELLDDRLGIDVTAEDLLQWNLGKYDGASLQVNSPQKFNAIAPLSIPDATKDQTKPFFLRLTTVIEGDFGIDAVAEKRKASPIGFTIRKRVDARDHYRYGEVAPYSATYFGALAEDQGPFVQVDDTYAAIVQATQLRVAHELPPIAGSVTIPHLDFSIDVGDRIKSINGRGVSLQVSGGSEAGEAKSYPFVVARTFNNSGDQQSTVLQLSDRRSEPAPIARRRG